MNILRKAMAREVEELKPVLDRVYAAILRFQRNRAPDNELAMRTAMAPAIDQLMQFRPLLPGYKQADFNLLEDRWRDLSAHDLIMLFDHCVSIMHVRLERRKESWEGQQPWTADLLHLLDTYRDAPAATPVAGEFLCSGIAASGGRAMGVARVVLDEAGFEKLIDGEILVCRFTLPEIVPYFRRIRALVTDEGGALSHAAIMAREYGIPAVTGCGDATTTIQSADRIEVDGDLGIVTAVR